MGWIPAPLSTLLGREDDIATVSALLIDPANRLLTLTGTGGVGKTRLALAVAANVGTAFPDGSWFVPLAAVRDPALVDSAIAMALGIQESPDRPLGQSIRAFLSPKVALLVIDNFEHILSAATDVVELLRCCPGLTVVVTSRSRLRVAGEHKLLVHPLSLPEPAQEYDPAVASIVPAVALFVERMREVKADFEITPSNVAAVAAICRHLDGLPLAIELAAARCSSLTPHTLAERLSDRFSLLTGGHRDAPERLQTLRNAIAWSYDLLQADEQLLFRRLAVFAGGWTLEAAQDVAGHDLTIDVFAGLSTLVDHNLVQQLVSSTGAIRFNMLETLREYGHDQLVRSGEEKTISLRHAEYYLELAEHADRESTGPNQVSWRRRLRSEQDNLRLALDRSFQYGDAVLVLRLTGALAWFWYTIGALGEGRRWLERALAINDDAPADVRAKVLASLGWIRLFHGDFDGARSTLEEALALYRSLDDVEEIANCLTNLAAIGAMGQRADIPVDSMLSEAWHLRPMLRNQRTVGNIAVFSGVHAFGQGNIERGIELNEEGLAVYRAANDIQGIIWASSNMGLLAAGLSDYPRATAMLCESLVLGQESDDKNPLLYGLYGLACVAAGTGDAERAARLWGAMDALSETTGLQITTITQQVTSFESHILLAKSQLGEQAFAVAWGEGKAMHESESIAYALVDTIAIPESVTTRSPTQLSTREREVLRLLVEGLSNQEIGSTLSISPHTAANHVANIMNKLGLESRTAAATWAVRHEIV